MGVLCWGKDTCEKIDVEIVLVDCVAHEGFVGVEGWLYIVGDVLEVRWSNC